LGDRDFAKQTGNSLGNSLQKGTTYEEKGAVSDGKVSYGNPERKTEPPYGKPGSPRSEPVKVEGGAA